jgi:tetratricopeptide (TPR) repeat protein
MAISRKVQTLITVPILCGFLGGLFAMLGGKPPMVWYRAEEHQWPLPHHIPKYPDNLTLRFAMVHDVIHERFPHHGAAYYRARNREVEQALAKLNPIAKGKEADEYFGLLDDWGVGLEFVGEHRKAVDLMRKKLKRQTDLGCKDRELYTTYANLGTFLILWQLSEGVADAAKAKERISESVQWIHQAIDVYPQSHFGRESWQVVLEEFLLAVLDNPKLLLEYDMVGDRLDRPFLPEQRLDCFDKRHWAPERGNFAKKAAEYLKNPYKGIDAERLSDFRVSIVRVGAEDGWQKEVKTSHKEPVPFDEPTLGIVGMWRMGAGANPHFALALGEIMLRVGQRRIAWTAYERAYRLKEHSWPDPGIQEQFALHCRARQKTIEEGSPGEDWKAVRARFDRDLAQGQQYQKDYDEYESQRLAKGALIADSHFYDAFESEHRSIATTPGDEEIGILVVKRPVADGWTLFLAGVCASAAAGLQMLFGFRSRQK